MFNPVIVRYAEPVRWLATAFNRVVDGVGGSG
jgi:hypothetical protein